MKRIAKTLLVHFSSKLARDFLLLLPQASSTPTDSSSDELFSIKKNLR